MRSFALIVALLFAPIPLLAQQQGEGGSGIWRYYATRIAHIQLVGIEYNGAIELASQGSGYLVDDRHVLTSNHVVPDVGHRYETLQTNVRLRMRKGEALRATVVARDETNDLALLELSIPLPPQPYCPVGVLMPPAALPPGSILYLMGFPLDRELSVASGLLSNEDGDGQWQTDAPLNIGNSGGPVFSSRGYLVAIAKGGVTTYTVGKETRRVEGINDLVAVSKLKSSPVGQWLADHSTSGCWQEQTSLPEGDEFAWRVRPMPVEAAVIAPPSPVEDHSNDAPADDAEYAANAPVDSSAVDYASSADDPFADNPAFDGANGDDEVNVGETVAAPAAPEPPLPDSIVVGHTLSEVKKDHGLLSGTKSYRRTFKAETGFLIEGCEFRAASANRESNVACVVAPDGRSATLQYTLASGPIFDQWRGWLRGTVSLDQRSAAATEGPPPTIVETLRVPVETIQSDHGTGTTSRTYEKSHSVAPRMQIVDCAFEAVSDNHADAIECRIAPDGRTASLTYELTSGPLFDRWRGWLKGDLVLKTVKSE